MIERRAYPAEDLPGMISVEDDGFARDTPSPEIDPDPDATEPAAARPPINGRSEIPAVALARAEAARLAALLAGR